MQRRSMTRHRPDQQANGLSKETFSADMLSRRKRCCAGTVVGGLLLFALGALLTASYVRLRRRQGLPAMGAVVPGAYT